MFNFIVEINISWIIRFIIFISLIIVGVLYYRKTNPQLKWPQKLLLTTLRFTVLGLILLPVLNATMIVLRQKSVPDKILLIMDHSKSMVLAHHADSLVELAGKIEHEIQNKVGIPVQKWTIGDSIHPVTALKDIHFNAEVTRLSAIKPLLNENKFNRILLMTDGQWNAGEDPALLLTGDKSIPVDVIAMGLAPDAKNYGISLAQSPSGILAGEKADFKIRIFASGEDSLNGVLSLSVNGKVQAKKRIKSDSIQFWKEVDMSFTPEEAGEYTVLIEFIPSKSIDTKSEDNRIVRQLIVEKNQFRILFLSDYPMPETGFFREFFKETGYVHFTNWFPGAPTGQLPVPDSIDAVILWNMNPNRLQKKYAANWSELIKKPIWINLNAGTADMFQALLKKYGVQGKNIQFRSRIIPEMNSFIANTFEDREKTIMFWKLMPEQSGEFLISTIPPQFSTVLEYNINNIKYPLLLIRKGMNPPQIISTINKMWQWKFQGEIYGDYRGGFNRFLTNILTYLSVTPDKLIRIDYDPLRDNSGKKVDIRFAVSPRLSEVKDYSIQYQWSDYRSIVKKGIIPLKNIITDNKISLPVVNNKRMKLQYSLMQGATALVTKEREFSFSQENRESVGTINQALLNSICSKSNGHYFYNVPVDSIIRYYAKDVQDKTNIQRAFLLRRNALLGFIILILLLGEWVIRKRYGLQ